MAEASFKPRLSGVRALIPPSCLVSRGALVSQVVWPGTEAVLGFKAGRGAGVLVACQLPPGLALLRGPESQPCVLGSWLCPEHPWGLSHSKAHPATLPSSLLGLSTSRPSESIPRQELTFLPTSRGKKKTPVCSPRSTFLPPLIEAKSILPRCPRWICWLVSD